MASVMVKKASGLDREKTTLYFKLIKDYLVNFNNESHVDLKRLLYLSIVPPCDQSMRGRKKINNQKNCTKALNSPF